MTKSIAFPFSHPSFLLVFTAPNKGIIWLMKENKGYSKLFLILIFIALPLSFLPFCSWLPSSYIFILFSSCWLKRMPVAILQQSSGYGSTDNKLAYALSMSLPLLLSPPAAFPPLYLREPIQAKIQPNNYKEFLTPRLMVMVLVVFNTAGMQAGKQGQESFNTFFSVVWFIQI